MPRDRSASVPDCSFTTLLFPRWSLVGSPASCLHSWLSLPAPSAPWCSPPCSPFPCPAHSQVRARSEPILLTGILAAGDLGHVHVFAERHVFTDGRPPYAPFGLTTPHRTPFCIPFPFSHLVATRMPVIPDLDSFAQGLREWVVAADRAVSHAYSGAVGIAASAPYPPARLRACPPGHTA